MKEKVIYLLLILLILASCAGNRKYDDLMLQADSIMDVDDDSATVAIRMLDGIKPQLPEFSQSQKMRYELLRYKAMNKAYISFTSDSIMKEVVDYNDRHGSANERMLANYVLGCVYRDLHEAPLALEYYNKATEQADTTDVDCDYGTLARVYNQMGVLFGKQYLITQELAAYEKGSKYALQAGDTLNTIRYYQNRMGCFVILGKIDSAINVNLNAAKMFKRIGKNDDAAIAFGSNYGLYLQQGDVKKAQKSFKVYLKTGCEENMEYEDSKAYILSERGLYYMFVNQLDSAYKDLSQSLNLCKSYSNKANTTKALAQYYSKVNQPKMAAAFALKSLEYQDSDFIETRNTQLQQLQGMYDYGRHQKLAVQAEKKAIQRSHIIYILVIACVTILVISAYIYRRGILLKKKRIAVTQLLYEDSLLKLQKLQEELSQLRKEKANTESSIIREKEEVISKLKEEVKDIRAKFSNPLLSDADIILRNSSIYKKLRYIEMHPMEKLAQEDWNELETTVERFIPSFIPLLKERLSEKEYRICLLVKFGFSTSFIATLLEITSSGVSASRKKMLEKLCNRVGTPKDFDEYVRKIQ